MSPNYLAAVLQKGKSPIFILILILGILCTGCSIPRTGLHAGAAMVPPSYALNDGRLTIHFIDVGQGDAELLQLENFTMLIDAGDPDAGPSVVSYLNRQGVRDIDLLVATHPHSDHIGGMQAVLKNFTVKKVLDSGMPHTSVTYEKFLETIERQKIPYATARTGDVLNPAPGLSLIVLNAPDASNGQDLNEASIVVRVSYGQMNMLFEGDAGSATEARMLSSGLPVQSQILKVAHHGGPHSSSSAFLERVSPEVAIISAGAGNQYNDPADETLERLGATGAIIFRTDRDGSIIIRTDGMKFSVVTEGEGVFPATNVAPPIATG
jgi:competence protein ComEC